MKITKSRRDYECYSCKGKISKGDLYRKKSVSVGSPNKPDKIIKKENGMVAFEAQGFRFDVQICSSCIAKEIESQVAA